MHHEPRAETAHHFHAAAFAENASLKQLATAFPQAERRPHHLELTLGEGGRMFLYPFGAVVFQGVAAPVRDAKLIEVGRAHLELTASPIVREEFIALEQQEAKPQVSQGSLLLDRVTLPRARIIALTVAQSAAMEYYEGIVDGLLEKIGRLVGHLERTGTVGFVVRPLHRFIGAAIATRTEVLSVLHLLDKPDETWDDPVIDSLYGELRAEFDLRDRYQALEFKLRSVQEALELVIGVVRDKRLVLLEAAIVVLIMVEIALTLMRY